jgi:hypothetical protein
VEVFKAFDRDDVGSMSLQDWTKGGVGNEGSFAAMDTNKAPLNQPFILTGCYPKFQDCMLSVGCRISPINTDVSSFLSFYIRTVWFRLRSSGLG